ncbi:MAG: hypothetical protein ABI844_08585 [Saprospiraceae bacterium]
MKFIALFLLYVGCIITACKDSPKSSAAAHPKAIEKSVVTAEDIERIAHEADYVDILFFNMAISVSQTDRASIVQTAHFFSPEVKTNTSTCPSMGRITLQSKGKILIEADIHFQGVCKYFTIIENKKPIGVTMMTKEGEYFLSSLINNYQPEKK